MVTKQHLEYFAKIASDNFINKQIPLTESIKNIHNDHQYLTTEHLKRIIETSNSQVYQHMYDTNEDKNIRFDVANPQDILKEEIMPEKVAYDNSAYLFSPKVKKEAEVQKTASQSQEISYFRMSNIKDEINHSKQMLESALNYLTEKKASFDRKTNEEYTKLFNTVSSLLEKTSFSKIATYLYYAYPEILSDITKDLINYKKINENDLEVVKEGSQINKNHELYKLAMNIKEYIEHSNIYNLAIKEAQNKLKLLKEAI